MVDDFFYRNPFVAFQINLRPNIVFDLEPKPVTFLVVHVHEHRIPNGLEFLVPGYGSVEFVCDGFKRILFDHFAVELLDHIQRRFSLPESLQLNLGLIPPVSFFEVRLKFLCRGLDLHLARHFCYCVYLHFHV